MAQVSGGRAAATECSLKEMRPQRDAQAGRADTAGSCQRVGSFASQIAAIIKNERS